MKIRSFPAILNQSIGQPIAAKMPLLKAVPFAAGLGLSMFSYSVHAVPASGSDTMQGLYDGGSVVTPFHGGPVSPTRHHFALG